MTKVTILLILAVLVYAGAGYLAMRIQTRFNNKLWLRLSDKDDELAGSKEQRRERCLTFEYSNKTTILIQNAVLRWFCIITVLGIWPISAPVVMVRQWMVYRRLMKKETTI